MALAARGEQPAVVKMLVACNAHNERVVFSDMVVKVNRKGLNQRRAILITNRGIYNSTCAAKGREGAAAARRD